MNSYLSNGFLRNLLNGLPASTFLVTGLFGFSDEIKDFCLKTANKYRAKIYIQTAKALASKPRVTFAASSHEKQLKKRSHSARNSVSKRGKLELTRKQKGKQDRQEQG